MSGRKEMSILFAFVLSVSLIAASAAALLTADHYNRMQFRLLGSVCQRIIKEQPEAEHAVLAALKGQKSHPAAPAKEKLLSGFGYRPSDFLIPSYETSILFAGAGFLFGGILFLFAFRLRHKKEMQRIEALTGYLETVNTGGPVLALRAGEDDFSKLQDEIYKTVTSACQTRDAALRARQNFAENLSNIAHQLKTPITAISLSTQMIQEPSAKEYAGQIRRQLNRLTRLEEALLLLSRLDAGTLPMELKTVDVFTALTLAADNLQEVLAGSGVSVHIPETGQVQMRADLEWTMEAVMNLMKNCMEHTPRGGTIHCSYEQNPLYTQMLIRDEGEGFAKEDMPYLFERFYRGQNAKDGGIGIGLSLAKAILERENGTIRAYNLPEGGACFEIRVYCH